VPNNIQNLIHISNFENYRRKVIGSIRDDPVNLFFGSIKHLERLRTPFKNRELFKKPGYSIVIDVSRFFEFRGRRYGMVKKK
jgi:hypothetical protein